MTALLRLLFQAVAKTPDRGDDVRSKLLPNARNKHFYGIGIAVKILIVNMFDQFGAGYDLTFVMQEIREQLIFLRGQFHRLDFQRHLARTEARRVGKEDVRPCRSRWSSFN